MPLREQDLGVQQIAKLCEVGRSTVNYWIRSKKLYAKRSGKSYEVPAVELVRFLKNEGRPIPEVLVVPDERTPTLAVFRRCWEYWKDDPHHLNCPDCVVLQNKIDVCFFAKNSSRLGCRQSCIRCRYYEEIYLPRLQFVDHIHDPAAVCKDLRFLAANRPWMSLCGLGSEELIGAGVERVFDSSSLERVFQIFHQKQMGETIPVVDKMFLKSSISKALETTGYFFPLIDPEEAMLVICRPEAAQSLI